MRDKIIERILALTDEQLELLIALFLQSEEEVQNSKEHPRKYA